MYAAHNTGSPYTGVTGYQPYTFPLPSMSGMGAMSGTEIAVGAIALGALWYFFKKRR